MFKSQLDRMFLIAVAHKVRENVKKNILIKSELTTAWRFLYLYLRLINLEFDVKCILFSNKL